MSSGKRIPLEQADALVNDLYAILDPLCSRVAVAGSVRRMSPDVGDIEMVVIPNPVLNLLGEARYESLAICEALKSEYTHIKGHNLYMQFDMGPVKLDLFVTTPEKWGVIYAIRTGPADFSHDLVMPKSQGGLMPSIYHVEDGRVWIRSDKANIACRTPEEDDLFTLFGMKHLRPQDR